MKASKNFRFTEATMFATPVNSLMERKKANDVACKKPIKTFVKLGMDLPNAWGKI